jgi:hypothetical protein
MTSKNKSNIKNNIKKPPPQSSPALCAREEAKIKIKIKIDDQPFGC